MLKQWKKDSLSKKNIHELKTIAKRFRIDGYSTLNKKKLVNKISEKLCYIPSFNIAWWAMFIIALITGLITYKSYIFDKESYKGQLKDKCNKNNPHTFATNDAFNINILDFNNYSVCSQKPDCENQLAIELSHLEDQLGIDLGINIELCSSKDLNLFTKKDFEDFALKTNSDVVIYGSTTAQEDSIEVEIQYALTQELKKKWVYNELDNQYVLGGKSIRKLYTDNGNFKNLEDVIIWNIGQYVIWKDSVQNGSEFRNILNHISSDNSSLKSMSHVLKGISYTKSLQVDSAFQEFNLALEVDSLNNMAYLSRGRLNLVLMNKEDALHDLYIGNILAEVNSVVKDKGLEYSKYDLESIKENGLIGELLKELYDKMDVPLALSFLLDVSYERTSSCKLTKIYYNYMRNMIDYEYMLWYPRLTEIESYIQSC